MIRFTLFGIPITVEPWFWISLALLGGALGADSAERIFQLLLFLLAGFVSILVHELGHALAGRAFRREPHIVLQALGGYAAFDGFFTRPQSAVVTLAGPVVQIVLGLLCFGILQFLPENTSTNGLYLLQTLATISWLWALLNLLPIVPLDGGQLVNALLGPRRARVTLGLSMVTALAVAVLGYLFFKSMILPIFMLFMAYQAYRALQQTR